MHDVVIRGGRIVDGSGGPARTGDVAIDGDRISAVGGKAGRGRREIDADGLIVTPGWVDIHTHYDGQATWDEMLAPSCWHGVTTVLFGNCGVGFAPVRAQHRQSLIELMEGVEEIPGITLSEGLKWDWETFPEYLDALARMPRAIDVAAQVPHHALRVYVMGERAIRREPATADDIAAMRRLTHEALIAGAFGFTTSRTDAHKTLAGETVPGRHASIDELMGIGQALGDAGHGVFGMLSDFENEESEFDWTTRLALATGCKMWFLMSQTASDPTRHLRLMRQIHAARRKGANLVGQVPGRPVGVLLGVDTEINPFSIRPSYQAAASLPRAERIALMRDPEFRRTVLADVPSPSLLRRFSPLRQAITSSWHRIFPLGNPPDYEPPASASVAALSQASGRTPDEIAYDYIAEDPANLLFFPIAGYVDCNHNVIRELLLDEATILGLADAGAHASSIVDASVPTFMLTHWARDRRRGSSLPLEFVVRLQTSDTAGFFGFDDRGLLAPGFKADLNLIDLDRLSLLAPQVRYDLPAGGRRLVQGVEGYRATIVSGCVTFEDGIPTGSLPGRLVRHLAAGG